MCKINLCKSICLLIQLQIHGICLSQNDLVFSQGPSFLKTTCCSTDVYRGCPKQPDKPKRFKGTCPVCARVSKITKRKGTLQSALPMEKQTQPGVGESFKFFTTTSCGKETKGCYNYTLHRHDDFLFWFRLWIVIFVNIIDNININCISL